MAELMITSPAFAPEGWMPNCHSGFGEDVSPEIHLSGMDAGAVSMAITLDDLGHPIHPGYNHWLAWNIPPAAVLPENLPKGAVCERPFHIEQGLAYGKHGYRGPKPPFNWNHRYRFTVYILDSLLNISTDANKAALLRAMEGHIIQTGFLFGKYQKKHA